MDLPLIIEQKKAAYKDANISVPNNQKFIHFDFEKDSMMDSLLDNEFDIKKPSVFLLEGIVYFINDKNLSEINNLNWNRLKSDLLLLKSEELQFSVHDIIFNKVIKDDEDECIESSIEASFESYQIIKMLN